MTKITVPIVDERPDTIAPEFDTEFAVSYEAANVGWNSESGDPTDCQPGGPGVLGGPEYVTLLQRTSTTAQHGYRVENFDLAAYPDHTFYSFNNADTGMKNVVAFTKAGEAVPSDIARVITAPTYATTLVTGLTATATYAAGTYTWGLTGGTITAGQGTNEITWTAGAAGTATFTCTFVNAAGIAAPAATPVTTTIVAVPTIDVIVAASPVANTTGGLDAHTSALQSGCTYVWSITGSATSSITSGQGTQTLVWASGDAGTATFHLVKTNLAGTISTSTPVAVTISA